MKELVLRSWRMMKADPSGLMCWFDPEREKLMLFELDPREDSRVDALCEGDDQYYEGGALDQGKPALLDEEGLPF